MDKKPHALLVRAAYQTYPAAQLHDEQAHASSACCEHCIHAMSSLTQVNKRKARASTACLGVVADLDRAQGRLTVEWDHGGRQVLSPAGLDQLLLRSGSLVGHAIAPVRQTGSTSDHTPALRVTAKRQGCKSSVSAAANGTHTYGPGKGCRPMIDFASAQVQESAGGS
jgi:hypothetical protein